MHHLGETHCQDDSLFSARVQSCCVLQAVLAVIIVVNLQGILAQFRDVCVLWKSDRLDLVGHTHIITQVHGVQ